MEKTSKITTFLSHWLDVVTCRDGKCERLIFREGVLESREVGGTNYPHGTIVEWQPSEEFFTHTEVNIDEVKKLFETIACLCKGLTINLKVNGESFSYFSQNGLNDYVDNHIKDKEIISNRLNVNFIKDKYKLDLVMSYTSNYNATIIPYVNMGLTESGPHITMFKTAITREFNKFFREKKILKDKDENLTGEDIQEGMYLVFNLTAPNVKYDAQVKSRIVGIETKEHALIFSEALREWLEQNEKSIKAIAEKALMARKAREAAKKARENVRAQVKKKEKALKFDSKLADCYSKDRSKCEIYIVEGDSASGNLKTARDNEFQAVLPIRGKILNTQKATLEQIQKNAEIMTMIDAFGLSIDTKTMRINYDPTDLRYDKIIIMSDADVDGAHIKNLFYTFIWNFCPQLVTDGHVYAGVPPLYKITIGKEYKYLKNDEALEKFRAANAGKTYVVQRMKGLGEMDVTEIEETLTDPNERIIKQITVEDMSRASKLFEDLMGTGIAARKLFIKEHSKEASYNV